MDGLIVNAAGDESSELVGLADAGTPVVLVDRIVRDCAGNSARLTLEHIGVPDSDRQERLVPTRLRIRARTRLDLDAEG